MPRKGEFIDVQGQRFGRLVVLGRAAPYRHGGREHVRWRCLCDCGAETVLRTSSLRGKGTVSCGCYTLDVNAERFITHGRSRTSTYVVWSGMLKRCTNPKSAAFADYGARGIKVCERWNVFENFFADMGERPSGLMIDRIDNDGDYAPGNCRWTTRQVQNRNTRRTKLNAELVQEVHGRCEHGETQQSVADRVGVTQGMIASIRNERTWRGSLAPGQ